MSFSSKNDYDYFDEPDDFEGISSEESSVDEEEEIIKIIDPNFLIETKIELEDYVNSQGLFLLEKMNINGLAEFILKFTDGVNI